MIEILKELNLNFVQQKTFEDLKDTLFLKFDFYIPTLNLCIEIDGEQHYTPVSFTKERISEKMKMNFDKLKKHDELKNNYCKNSNISLLRIPWRVRKQFSGIPVISDKQTLKKYFSNYLKSF